LDTGAAVAVLGCDTHKFTNVMSVPKGIIWLLLATVAEVTPTVCLEPLDIPLGHPVHRHLVPQMFLLLNLNGIFPFSTADQ
jgi:hypothetical protein